METHHREILGLVRAALAEDIGKGDLTSMACLEPDPVKAEIVAKSNGVLSGVEPALMAFEIVDSANEVSFEFNAGERFLTGDTIARINGFNQTVLSSERVALNFLGHLSGIATCTAAFVERIKGTGARILDTRKTTPGWRCLEKMAVLHGGGSNHRFGLYDMILIKDNHIASAGSITKAVAQAREFLGTGDFRLQFEVPADQIQIEVEVTSESELTEAIAAGVNRLLLDNQAVESLAHLVTVARKLDTAVELEASGNVTLDTVAAIAATGVDFISVGALTHSAPTSDFSLRVTEQPA
jgi:nicotinate-nucleotide pyrophosphorylase (carboxylating)